MIRVEFPLSRPTCYFEKDVIQQLYPIGSVMSIKEPYVRFSPTAALPEIDIGFPTDIVLLPGTGRVTWAYDHPVRPHVCCPTFGPTT